MATEASAQHLLSVDGLDQLIRQLHGDGHTVIGPVVRDRAIVLDEIDGVADLPAGWTTDPQPGSQRLRARSDGRLFGHTVGPDSARRWLQPPEETLVHIRRRNGVMTVDPEPPAHTAPAFVGLRACDLAAIAVQDRVLRDGEVADPRYEARRNGAVIVAVECTEAASTCFCASMGTGPAIRDGFDLALTELVDDGPHRFVVRAGSDRGAALLARVERATADQADIAAAVGAVEQCASRQGRRLDPVDARTVLADALEHPRWDDVASRCLSCGNCTAVCPTCFCTAVEDRTAIDDEDLASRTRRWDSCFSLDHSYLHGGGPVRGDTRSRYRQWLTHKLSTWWDQFDTSGCVGCGRCITWCPVGIDLVEEVAAMSGPDRVRDDVATAGTAPP